MATNFILPAGQTLLYQQVVGGVKKPYYFLGKTSLIFNADGKNVDTLLEERALKEHGVHVPTPVETSAASSLKFLREDNTWAEIQQAAVANAETSTDALYGIVRLSDSTSLDDSTYAATAKAVKTVYDLANHTHPYVETSLLGVANGVATLDKNGTVPASQLPSYVDDVVVGNVYVAAASGKAEAIYTDEALAPVVATQGDVSTVADLMAALRNGSIPATVLDGIEKVALESGKIYLDASTNNSYRYTGVDSAPIVLISESLALGITASSAFRGDYGQIAYEHAIADHARVDATHVSVTKPAEADDGEEVKAQNGYIFINGVETPVYVHPQAEGASSTNPHGTTKTDVGLGNVEDKSSETIRSEITAKNVTDALTYEPARKDVATDSADGLMSASDKVKLDRSQPIYVGTTAPDYDCIFCQIVSDEQLASGSLETAPAA